MVEPWPSLIGFGLPPMAHGTRLPILFPQQLHGVLCTTKGDYFDGSTTKLLPHSMQRRQRSHGGSPWGIGSYHGRNDQVRWAKSCGHRCALAVSLSQTWVAIDFDAPFFVVFLNGRQYPIAVRENGDHVGSIDVRSRCHGSRVGFLVIKPGFVILCKIDDLGYRWRVCRRCGCG